MKKIIFLLSVHFSLSYYCQVTHNIHLTSIHFPYERIDNEWFADKIKQKYTKNERKETIDAYAKCLLDEKEYYYSSDLEYTDWPEANEYLKKVFKELYKNDNISPLDINIKVIRDPELNASAHEDGTIFVNIGMLAALNSEAQIASVFGHEWGHVALGHSFKNFKSHVNYSRSTSIGNGLSMLGFGITGFIVAKVSENEYEGSLISNEVDADNNAVLSSLKSLYNNSAGLEVQNLFSRRREKEKLKIGYQKPRNYISTHPSTKKRIEFFKKAIENDSTIKKNFIVDSIYFVKLKQQAIDETIYLLFKEQNFNDCIELAFTQYLKYPKDNFYLFFLIESIRRLLAANSALTDKNFITGNYVLKQQKVQKPLAIVSSKYKTNTTGEFVYQNTIFNHLDILFIDSNDIKNKRLANSDTLEFITNADALQYFRSEAKANNCFMCALDDNLKSSDLKTKTLPENNIEDYYNKLPGTYNTYLLNKEPQEQKCLIVVEGFYGYSAFSFGTEDGGEKEFLKKFKNHGEEKFPGKFATTEKLNLKEYNDIFRYYYGVNRNLPKSDANSPYIGIIVRDYDCKNVFPELTEILQKHNFDKVFYVTVTNYDYGTYSNDHCLVTMIDLKKNKIAKSGTKSGALSSVSAYEKSYEMIEELRKK
jgi:Zn-dependent protease with chaperone function